MGDLHHAVGLLVVGCRAVHQHAHWPPALSYSSAGVSTALNVYSPPACSSTVHRHGSLRYPGPDRWRPTRSMPTLTPCTRSCGSCSRRLAAPQARSVRGAPPGSCRGHGGIVSVTHCGSPGDPREQRSSCKHKRAGSGTPAEHLHIHAQHHGWRSLVRCEVFVGFSATARPAVKIRPRGSSVRRRTGAQQASMRRSITRSAAGNSTICSTARCTPLANCSGRSGRASGKHQTAAFWWSIRWRWKGRLRQRQPTQRHRVQRQNARRLARDPGLSWACHVSHG